jgi:hypothetical protein
MTSWPGPLIRDGQPPASLVECCQIMPDWIHNITLRLVIAVAMTVGLVLSPVGIAISHGPGLLGILAAVPAAADHGHGHGHGHSHDDDGPVDPDGGHAHHNPADHSHDQPDRPVIAFQASAAPHRDWWVSPDVVAAPAAPGRLDRPPTPFFAA